MEVFEAVVKDGRIVLLDASTELPDGTEVLLRVVDEEEEDDFDDLDEEETLALEASLERGWQQIQAGQYRPMEDVLAEMRARRGDSDND